MSERLFRVRLLQDRTYYDTNAQPWLTLHAGDILVCGRMAWPWSVEKYAAIMRESDGFLVERSILKTEVEMLGEVPLP